LHGYLKSVILVENQHQTIMIKIEGVDLRRFDNNEHFQFMTGFDKLISTHKTVVTGTEVTYGIFKNTLMAEDLAMRIEQGSSAAQTLDRLDRLRDKTLNAIHMRLNATLSSPFHEEVESAQFIKHIINLYGDVCTLTYSEQSAAIENLTDDLELPVIAIHTNKIGISEWVSELKKQNRQFTQAFDAVNSEFARRESNDVKAVRTLIDPVYMQLVERINASIILEFAQPEVIDFAQKLNDKIKYYNTPLVYRNSGHTVGVNEEV
jgi:hypothetical protein